jgi:hypothetical protein
MNIITNAVLNSKNKLYILANISERKKSTFLAFANKFETHINPLIQCIKANDFIMDILRVPAISFNLTAALMNSLRHFTTLLEFIRLLP